MGIEIAANAVATLVKELSLDKLNSIRFFSDSMIALYWVLKRKMLRKFIDNRSGKIHENIRILEKRKLKTLFHPCPTDQNPADISSRGSGMDKLFKNKLWFEGPEFLRKPEKEWPVGLDYFGPVSYTGVMGIKKKTWVLLITCLITRAVHLELVTDNSTITYLMALKRYFGRRGVPKTILCDNAPGFLLGNKMINDDIRNRHHSSDTLTTFLATKEIELKTSHRDLLSKDEYTLIGGTFFDLGSVDSRCYGSPPILLLITQR
uniref:Integrase catalytic domain-containing protein n=1 Tax=Caenorhabditis japonica TaxID=281687 RepID=A0A8R1DMF4_CAEJA